MPIPYPNARKALSRLTRNDPEGSEHYRAQLRYRHFRPRFVLTPLQDGYYQGTHPLPRLPGASAWTDWASCADTQ